MKPKKYFHTCLDLAWEIINTIDIETMGGIPTKTFYGDVLTPYLKSIPLDETESRAIGLSLIQLETTHPDCVCFELAHVIDHILAAREEP